MKLLIRYSGDNDFITVVKAFGEIILMKCGAQWNDAHLTKANIVRWFNMAAPVLYEMVQCKDRNELKRLINDIVITEDDVFIGDEADIKMQSWHEWGNHDGVLIDIARSRMDIV